MIEDEVGGGRDQEDEKVFSRMKRWHSGSSFALRTCSAIPSFL